MAQVDGITIKVGDSVSFKSDTEQYGIVTKIMGNKLTLKSPWDEGFQGSYIGGSDSTVVHVDDEI